MMRRIQQVARRYANQMINSIALYPALIALVFLLISYLVLHLDFSPYGKQIKSHWDFLTLKDASTARTIAATIAGGILSLTVFSFSMVMILLNQAASNMSNRVLGSMIGNRFQQVVLGFYIGTIVYALFLLSTIRDIDSGIYVPALSVYLLILLTIVDIFLFIYFIHYITQSVKFETIIDHIHQKTRHKLQEQRVPETEPVEPMPSFEGAQELKTEAAGYFQGFNRKQLLKLCAQHNWQILFLFPLGSYVLKGVPYLKINAPEGLTEDHQKQIAPLVDFYRGESVADNSGYGFKQLVEVALKALSPGVNDPGTAVLSLHALFDLLSFRLQHAPFQVLRDEQQKIRIIPQTDSFQEVFRKALYPIWDYGQNDRILRNELMGALEQLLLYPASPEDKAMISALRKTVAQKMLEKE
ncbi:DUF2254 domain-containing protein [Rufibacter sediminis]|uniref:DUF2254 domain-containing protein n=1 Tax=Rufibacter sediminis TaxID=2762756 RepID=A0ABR6VUU7_9BACT|nr:DUF2254 domain-containing protein [Rufibacter sediminis]MBC3540381.1 DUF2254 domain-containing protein [Rufibacter sediminis]